MDTGCFPRVRRLGRDVGPSPPTSAEVKNGWSYISAPPVQLNGVDRNIFTFSSYDKIQQQSEYYKDT